ncbi:hypothetical protein AM571_PA00211 (plasmid) [Rhizobium etli 8C-3]|uniref:Uncharacterized protein n=1 Tax=Rhizobium etli 8C-3 TaxID=538025 RepID=A0A1L5PAH4_RHIET|nr:hypothetical protein AM571_PA00211 [Rhizobium etli 8C-3]
MNEPVGNSEPGSATRTVSAAPSSTLSGPYYSEVSTTTRMFYTSNFNLLLEGERRTRSYYHYPDE